MFAAFRAGRPFSPPPSSQVSALSDDSLLGFGPDPPLDKPAPRGGAKSGKGKKPKRREKSGRQGPGGAHRGKASRPRSSAVAGGKKKADLALLHRRLAEVLGADSASEESPGDGTPASRGLSPDPSSSSTASSVTSSSSASTSPARGRRGGSSARRRDRRRKASKKARNHKAAHKDARRSKPSSASALQGNGLTAAFATGDGVFTPGFQALVEDMEAFNGALAGGFSARRESDSDGPVFHRPSGRAAPSQYEKGRVHSLKFSKHPEYESPEGLRSLLGVFRSVREMVSLAIRTHRASVPVAAELTTLATLLDLHLQGCAAQHQVEILWRRAQAELHRLEFPKESGLASGMESNLVRRSRGQLGTAGSSLLSSAVNHAKADAAARATGKKNNKDKEKADKDP